MAEDEAVKAAREAAKLILGLNISLSKEVYAAMVEKEALKIAPFFRTFARERVLAVILDLEGLDSALIAAACVDLRKQYGLDEAQRIKQLKEGS